MVCTVCDGTGCYPIYDNDDEYLYDITCPECHGVGGQDVIQMCDAPVSSLSEMRARLPEMRAQVKKHLTREKRAKFRVVGGTDLAS